MNKELITVLNNYIKATNSHDFKEVMKCIASDAIYWFTNKTCENIDEIEVFFCNAWEKIKEEKYSAHDIIWVSVSELSATCVYSFKWEGYIDGIMTQGGGRATNVFQKKEGKWLLTHEHLSSYPLI